MMKEKSFCPYCSGPLSKKDVEGRRRHFCSRCNQPIYENPVPATCLVVMDKDRQILLVKRNVDPQKGKWCLPGGFLELDESPEQGALRELNEETGLEGRIEMLLGVRTTPSYQYHSVLMIGFSVIRFCGCPMPGDDAQEVKWASYAELPPIAFDSHRFFIDLLYNKSH